MIIEENTPYLETDRLILRKFNEDDTNALLDILSDKAVNTYLPWFLIDDVSEASKFLKVRFLDYYKMPSAYRYAICLKKDNVPIGYVWMSNTIDRDFGYGLRSDFWNQGIATEAVKAIISKIKNAGYPYITATHDVNNLASGIVMSKLGMEYKYTYTEFWQPKNINVNFRMYQLNFDSSNEEVYMEYWNKYENHFIEDLKDQTNLKD